MVDATENRVTALSTSHHLPKGVTKEGLAAAKSGVDSLKSMWSEASNASASRSEEHTSELQSPCNLVCRLLLEKKKKINQNTNEPKAIDVLSAAHDQMY